MRWAYLLVLAAACRSSDPPAKLHPAPAPAAKPSLPAVADDTVVRGLTDGEIALVRPYFGDSLDYAKVRVRQEKFTPFQDENTYMTPAGEIYAPGALYSEDFSDTSVVDAWTASIFVHEMTHVWQFQSGLDIVAAGLVAFVGERGAYEKAYPYTLAHGRDLTQYGVEQQAEIIEDWWLIHHGYEPTDFVDAPADTAKRDALYQETLQSLLADPSYASKLSPDELMRRQSCQTTGDC
jgi:type VI secretion system secreted protein VgrG